MRKNIPGLDGLRALSVFLVLVHHCYHSIPGIDRLPNLAYYIVGNGHLGVTFFLVLSGFLITYLLSNEYRTTARVRLGAFYYRRALRILPAFVCYLLTVLVLSKTGVLEVSSKSLLVAATSTWNYRHLFWGDFPVNQCWWYLGHLWSLALENQFYLFWPVIFFLVGPRWAGWGAAAAFLLFPLIRITHYYCNPSLRGSLGMMLHTAADSIMCGCLLGLVYDSSAFRPIRKIASSSWVFWCCVTFLGLLAPVLTWRFHGAFAITVGLSLESLAIAAMIIWVIHHHATTLVGRYLTWKPVEYLGRISYSVYLWQPLILAPPILEKNSLVHLFPINLAAVFILAEASYRLVEKPMNQFRFRLQSESASPGETSVLVVSNPHPTKDLFATSQSRPYCKDVTQ